MTGLRRLITAFLLLKLAVLTHNLMSFPVLNGVLRPKTFDRPRSTPLSRASLLVPMRNEAARLADSLPGLLRQSVGELIFLDDESDDDSAALVRGLLIGHPTARVMTGTTAPPGWAGKNWACHQLSEQAIGDVLVFCDLDTRLAAGALEDALSEMEFQRADAFSVFPRQLTITLAEKLIVSVIDDVLLCFLPFRLLRAPVPAAATANGSLLVFTRSAYERIGGFAAVRSAIVEDVALARLVRRSGLKLGLALGGELVQTRMYDSYPAVIFGLGRGLRSLAGGSRSRLVGALGWQLIVYTLPLLMMLRRRQWLLPLVLAVFEHILVAAKTGRRLDASLLLTAVAPVSAIPVIVQALRPTQRWKGRVCL